MADCSKNALLKEFEQNKIPKRIQDTILNHMCLSKSETPDTYLLHTSKHVTHRALRTRHDDLKSWIERQGGIFQSKEYNCDRERCGKTEKYCEVRFFFPSFHPYKELFSYLGYASM